MPTPSSAAKFEGIPELGITPDSNGMDLAAAPVMLETLEALNHGNDLLRQAGASLHDVVKLSIYLVSMADLYAVDRVLRHVFKEKPPAVTVIQVPELPVRGSRVEIEITAYRK